MATKDVREEFKDELVQHIADTLAHDWRFVGEESDSILSWADDIVTDVIMPIADDFLLADSGGEG